MKADTQVYVITAKHSRIRRELTTLARYLRVKKIPNPGIKFALSVRRGYLALRS